MTYAAANNVPVLVRNGRAGYLQYDKMPVGKGESSRSFSLFELDLKPNDILYLYTDGYADQFGGPEGKRSSGKFGQGKKFMYRRLNEKLQDISSSEMDVQRSSLEKAFDDWKGDLEQVDDVCVIGIRI
jgi:serine phosphatase RsbU (regulator of sigma subunit)